MGSPASETHEQAVDVMDVQELLRKLGIVQAGSPEAEAVIAHLSLRREELDL